MKKMTAVLLLCAFACTVSACRQVSGFDENFQEKFINNQGFEYKTCPWNSTKKEAMERVDLPESYFDAGETKENGEIVHFYSDPPENSESGKSLKPVPIHMQDLNWGVDHISFLFRDDQLKAISLMKEYRSGEEMETEIESLKTSVLKLSLPQGTVELINPQWPQEPLESLTVQYVKDEGVIEYLYRAPDGTYMVLRFWYQGTGESAQHFMQLSITDDRDILISRLYLGKGSDRGYLK